VKIGDQKNEFVSLTKDDKVWNDVLNNSERGAVLTAGAAFEVHLERLLKAFLVQGVSTSKKIAESSQFSSKINLCFSLGLISEDEKHDLNLLRDIRNAFAHNIFGCDFNNSEVSKAINSLILPSKTNFPKTQLRNFFNVGMIIIDNSLVERIGSIKPLIQKANLIFSN